MKCFKLTCVTTLFLCMCGCNNGIDITAPDFPEDTSLDPLQNQRSKTNTILAVFAQTVDDTYPFPSKSERDEISQRISDFFEVMSYGLHIYKFKEAIDDNYYFVSDASAHDYKAKYNGSTEIQKNYSAPFGLFNDEILQKVKNKYGASYFADVDLIVVFGTDGGRGWYKRFSNATGYRGIGVEFNVNDKVFDMDLGGVTVEIGSSAINSLYPKQIVHWTLAHELGHVFGLPHSAVKLGAYGLMTPLLFETKNMPEFGPVPLNLLSLLRLGWIDELDTTRAIMVTRAMKEVVVTLNQIRTRTGPIVVKIDLPEANEAFYLTYHRQTANRFDGAYAGEGLLIQHHHAPNRMDIECTATSGANGRDHLDDGVNREGLATDFFKTGFEFTPRTNPSSNYWGLSVRSLINKPSGVAVVDIREVGDQVSFRVVFE